CAVEPALPAGGDSDGDSAATGNGGTAARGAPECAVGTVADATDGAAPGEGGVFSRSQAIAETRPR
ncbi:MAG TPA: hypothetical protein VGK73_18820, partial [Polyangiaceae bacterium]